MERGVLFDCFQFLAVLLRFPEEGQLNARIPGAKEAINIQLLAIVISIVLAFFYSAFCQSSLISMLNDKWWYLTFVCFATKTKHQRQHIVDRIRTGFSGLNYQIKRRNTTYSRRYNACQWADASATKMKRFTVHCGLFLVVFNVLINAAIVINKSNKGSCSYAISIF